MLYRRAFLALALLLVGFMFTGKITHAATVYYVNPGDNLTAAVNKMIAGDTLLLNDGIYYSPLAVQGKIGTASAQFTIKAVNDGKAIIDGSKITTNYSPPVFIGQGSSYIDLEGIVARNAPASATNTAFDESVVYVYGSNNSQGGADHITIKRVTAYNAGLGNVHVFNVAFGATNVLIEDSAAWGRGRYDFIAYQSDHVTFRRDWGHWEPGTTFNAPRAPFSVYGASNVTLENDIGTNAVPTNQDVNFFTGIFATTSSFPTTNMVVRGSMFYGNCEGPWVNGGIGNGTVFQNDYFDEPTVSACPANGVANYGDGLSWQSSSGSGSFANDAFIHSAIGFHRGSTSVSSPSIANTVFASNGTGIVNDPGHSYSDWFGNGNNGTTLVGTDKAVDPGYDTTTYGRGAYLFIPPSSPLHGTGNGGADIGANAIYQYQDGTLTNAHLWPWPMESRIQAERGISVTYDSGGGLFKTLSGVYPMCGV